MILQALLHLHYFYPRSPCGERHFATCCAVVLEYFYPRSPCGERHETMPSIRHISYFYPRSPCGERPALAVLLMYNL